MLQFQPQEHLLHSYIVASQSEQARDRLSLDLAAAMLCRSDGVRPCRTCRDCRKVYDGVHPDVIYVAPDPDAKVPTIKVDQIRGVAATAYILPPISILATLLSTTYLSIGAKKMLKQADERMRNIDAIIREADAKKA